MSTTVLKAQRKQVEQLRREAEIKRTKVSISCKDLIDYCEEHSNEDGLVKGKSANKPNKKGNQDPYVSGGICPFW